MSKKNFAIGLILITIFAGISCVFAEEEPSLFWYRVKMQEGQDTYDYLGTSLLDEKQFIKKLLGEEFIVIENLVYKDQMGKIKSLTEWDPYMKSKIYINPKHVIVVVPLKGDPRKE